MTDLNEAAEVRREASGLLQLLTAEIGHPRYAMGERVSLAFRISLASTEGNECRIEVLCHAFGSLDAGWADYCAVLNDEGGASYKLPFDARGRAVTTRALSPGVRLRGVRIVSKTTPVVLKSPKPTVEVRADVSEESVVRSDIRYAAQVEVGELFTPVYKEFRSREGQVSARVSSPEGSVLSVQFSASAEHLDLAGARITFRFFTDAGTEVGDELQLWPDARDASQLVAFWGGDQTNLAPAGISRSIEQEQKCNLAFEFEVHPRNDSE